MTDGQDDFKLDGLSLGDQLVELGLASRTQNSLVEVEQGVSSDGDLLASRLRATRSRTSRGSSLRCAGLQTSAGIRSLSHSQPALSLAAAAAGVQ
jgi:hypothetical protein